MSRVTTTNYGADPDTTFQYATDDADPFDRNDISYVARALERHEHTPGRGVQLTTDGFADGTISGAKLAPGAVTTDKLADGAVTTPKIQDGAVTTNKINPAQITTGHIQDGAVTDTKIPTDAIHAGHLRADSVGASEIVTGAIGTLELADLAITNAKLAVDTIDLSTKAAPGSLTGSRIAPTTIPGDEKLIPSTVTGNASTSAIGSSSIHPNRLQDNSLGTGAWNTWTNSQAILPNSALAGGITNDKLAGGITNDKLAGGITPDKLTGFPVIHGENASSSALTTSASQKLQINVTTAGRYLIHMTVILTAVDSLTGDNTHRLQAWIVDGTGQFGPTLEAVVPTFTPAQNQTFTLHFTYNRVLAAGAPLAVQVKKSGGTGNSQYGSSYLDAQWVAVS